MTEMAFEVDEASIRATLAAIDEELQVVALADLQDKANRVVAAMVRLAPISEDDPHPRRLVDSIGQRPGMTKTGPYIDVGSFSEGEPIVEAWTTEFGTRHAKAKPWARPALAEVFGSLSDTSVRVSGIRTSTRVRTAVQTKEKQAAAQATRAAAKAAKAQSPGMGFVL